MAPLVLHHYKESPYAEKIRALFGYKGVSWHSVTVPRIAPKPDLIVLTGGYRKVPVLQCGADVYCDTRLIIEEIECRQSEPTTVASPGSFNQIVEDWVDVSLFGKAVSYTLGQNVDHLPDAFLADRAALRGAPLIRSELKAAVPVANQELARHVRWVDRALCAGLPFVNGQSPGSGDFTLYSTLWFAARGRFDFTPFPAVVAWMARIQAFGHGQAKELSAEDALALAAENAPMPLDYESTANDPSGLILGQMVMVTPEMLGHGTGVRGELIGLNDGRLTLLISTPRCGSVHVHFPRHGYRLTQAR
jgi:glutathione S-transferase